MKPGLPAFGVRLKRDERRRVHGHAAGHSRLFDLLQPLPLPPHQPLLSLASTVPESSDVVNTPATPNSSSISSSSTEGLCEGGCAAIMDSRTSFLAGPTVRVHSGGFTDSGSVCIVDLNIQGNISFFWCPS